MSYFYLIITVVLIVLTSIIGVLFVNKKLIKLFNQYNKRFVAFSTGVFLMMVLSILNELWQHHQNQWLVLGLVLAGFVFANLLNLFLPEIHQHHDQDCHHHKNKQLAFRVVVGDAIHNIGDGIILVPAFAISTNLGLITGLSILIHEALQELSEFFVLKKAGYSTKKALWQNFVASLTIIIGVIVGLIFQQNELIMASLLAFSAGMFSYLIISDLLPEIYHNNKKQTIINALMLGLGFCLLLIIGSLAPHSHDHQKSDHDHQQTDVDICGIDSCDD